MILKEGGKKDRIELKENWSEKFQLSRKHIVLPGARTCLCWRLTQEEQVQGRSGWAGLGGSLWVSGAQSCSSAPARHSLSCPSSRTQPSNQHTRVLLRGHAALRALQEILFFLRVSHPSPIPAQTDL